MLTLVGIAAEGQAMTVARDLVVPDRTTNGRALAAPSPGADEIQRFRVGTAGVKKSMSSCVTRS